MGYDKDGLPFIYQAISPGIITDYTVIGFHAIGTGAEKAVSQLLFSDHKRTNGVVHTLYECFDAKAYAEMALGVGYEWDACFVTTGGLTTCPPDAKEMIEQVWAKSNRSPFKKEKEKDELDDPPDDWEDQLKGVVAKALDATVDASGRGVKSEAVLPPKS